MIFERIKPLDQILATAEKKGLVRQLGWFQLMMLGIGAIIGTGIFVLTSVAAEKAGPGMMYSFLIAGFVCALTALVYAEIASMVPVAGSAYTYSYAVLGELIAYLEAERNPKAVPAFTLGWNSGSKTRHPQMATISTTEEPADNWVSSTDRCNAN